MKFLDKVRTVSQTPVSQAETPTTLLSVEELEFVLAKLRSATYKGEEFETFYTVWMKLVTEIETRR